MTQDQLRRQIMENILYLTARLQHQIVADVNTGRLHVHIDDKLLDLEDHKGIIEGQPEVMGKIYKTITITNQLLEQYVTQYGPLVTNL